jgi:hypothetical protein
MIVYEPAAAYVCVTVTPLPDVPSPKFQLYATIDPSGSEELDPLNATDTPTVAAWSAPALATGGRFAIVAVAVALELRPPLSVTVSVTVYSPAAAYA